MEEAKNYPKPSIVRILRESNGFSQEYVASKLSLTQQAYSNLEKNPENASIKRMKELAQIFSVPVTSLIGESESYVQQNFQQQGGQAATIIHVQGIPEQERNLYEMRISELKEQIQLLKEMINKLKG